MGLVTLTLTLVCNSHPRWRTFLPNLGTVGLWVLELFAMYATDGRTKATLKGGGTIITFFYSVDDAVMCALRFTETQ